MAKRTKGAGRGRVNRNQMTPKRYEKILKATRAFGFKSQATVAKESGVHRTTVAKAWKEGWPELGLPNMRHVIAEEQSGARAELWKLEEAGQPLITGQDVQEAEQERAALERGAIDAAVEKQLEFERAKADRVQARKEEVVTIRTARRNAMALNTSCALLTQKLIKVAQSLDVEKMQKLRPKEKVALIRSTARAVVEASDAAKQAIQMERLLLGEPTDITKVVGEDMSPNEAVRWIEEAADAVRRRKQFEEWSGELEVVEGGKATG